MASGLPPGFPQPFGDYLLLSSFGRGGMGEVFLAKKSPLEGLERLCVIKTLRGDLAHDGEYVRRFLDEARIVMQLHHGNVCQVFDAGLIDETYYLAMEYISGVNVRELSRDLASSEAALEPGIALYIASQTLDALAYAHRLRHPMTGEALHLIHRDVSPHNVMVSFEGEVKLIDFGLARSALKEEQTASEVVLGKSGYMSPEQARGEEVDPSCDQFAASVMTYELLAHDRYYGDLNSRQIWQISGRGGFVPRLLDHLDPELQKILTRGWAPTPSARYPSCEAMREALDDFRALRYPRVGKKQTRALLQGLYQQRMVRERELLASAAEATGPGRSARSTSVAAPHPTAMRGSRPLDLTESQTLVDAERSEGPDLDSVSDPPPAAERPSPAAEADQTSILSRQERAFHAAAPTSATRLSRLPWVAALLGLVGVVGVAGVFLGAPDGDSSRPPAVEDLPPLVEDPGPEPEAAPPSQEPGPEPEPVASPPPPEDDKRKVRARGRRARRKTTSKGEGATGTSATPPPTDEPEPEPKPKPPEPPETRPPETRPPEPAKSPDAKEAPKPPRLSLGEAMQAIHGCKERCAPTLIKLQKQKPERFHNRAGFQRILECAWRCQGWKKTGPDRWSR